MGPINNENSPIQINVPGNVPEKKAAPGASDKADLEARVAEYYKMRKETDQPYTLGHNRPGYADDAPGYNKP